MNALLLLALAIAPGLAISIFIYRKDRFDKEPPIFLITSFILGMLAIVPAILIEQTGAVFSLASDSTIMTLIYAFIVVGFTEEFCKFFVLRFYAYRKPEFNEPFDGITYSVMVSMGFATLENIFYVFQFGMGNAFWRMLTAVPAHASFGIVMGYYAGLAKFSLNPKALLFRGWFLAALLHGAYDFSLMDKNIPMITLGAGLSLYLGIRFSIRAMKLHQDDSPFRDGF
jgi:RsiW-degrading membrane proteinase PrsW (M82 family)